MKVEMEKWYNLSSDKTLLVKEMKTIMACDVLPVVMFYDDYHN